MHYVTLCIALSCRILTCCSPIVQKVCINHTQQSAFFPPSSCCIAPPHIIPLHPLYLTGGLWILSPRWLADSLLADNILSEEGYEVPGYQKAGTAFAPQRARLRVCAALALSPRDVGMARSSSGHVIDSTQNRPRNTSQNPESTVQDPSPSLLFNGMVFLLYGSFPNSGPPRSDIADLLRRGQGTVVSTIKELLATCSDHVPVGIKKSKGLSECNDDVIGMTRHHSPNHITAKAVATSSCSKV